MWLVYGLQPEKTGSSHKGVTLKVAGTLRPAVRDSMMSLIGCGTRSVPTTLFVTKC